MGEAGRVEWRRVDGAQQYMSSSAWTQSQGHSQGASSKYPRRNQERNLSVGGKKWQFLGVAGVLGDPVVAGINLGSFK